MNSILKSRRFELWYLCGAMGIALLLYGGLKWYHSSDASLTPPPTRSEALQDVQRSFQQANQLYKEGKYQEALTQYHQTIALQPRHAQAHTMISLLCMRSNNYDHAQEHARHAIEANRNYVPAYLALGQCHLQRNALHDAKIAYQDALAIDPNNLEANILVAQLLCKENSKASCEQAMEYARKALSIQPNNFDARFALGDAFLTSGQPERARKEYELVVNPGQEFRTKLYIGQTYEREHNFSEAAKYYRESIGAMPNFAQSHIALAGAYFALGQLGQGFKEYEWRWHVSNMKDLQNKWDGSDPKDKKIVILSENGIGDILQYVRFAQEVKKRGGHTLVVVNKLLVPLLKQCPYIDELIPAGEQITGFDSVTSMQSIPAILGINEHTLPNKPYLFADQNLVNEWKRKLASDTNFKIGLCWQPGDDSYMNLDQKRGISLDQLKPLARDGVSFYCLQMGGTTHEHLAHAPFKINKFDETFDKAHGAFMDTAAVMKNMDLIITVDTSVAHLAGGLGVPTWILLPYAADVRWETKRDDSVWYSNMKLFRQKRMGAWDEVVDFLVKNLKEKIS